MYILHYMLFHELLMTQKAPWNARNGRDFEFEIKQQWLTGLAVV